MMKRIIVIITIILISTVSYSQKYFTQNGSINLFSKAPLEDIKAVNNKATCIVDIEKGEIASKIPIEAFVFKRALMQEHFNENYLESDKYPYAILTAKIVNFASLDFQSTKKQSVQLEGDLNIHNVSNKVTINGSFVKKDNTFQATSTFEILTADYDIKIPKAVRNKIAKKIEISLKFDLKEFNKQ